MTYLAKPPAIKERGAMIRAFKARHPISSARTKDERDAMYTLQAGLARGQLIYNSDYDRIKLTELGMLHSKPQGRA